MDHRINGSSDLSSNASKNILSRDQDYSSHCHGIKCSNVSALLSNDEISSLMKELCPSWVVDSYGKCISRTFSKSIS